MDASEWPLLGAFDAMVFVWCGHNAVVGRQTSSAHIWGGCRNLLRADCQGQVLVMRHAGIAFDHVVRGALLVDGCACMAGAAVSPPSKSSWWPVVWRVWPRVLTECIFSWPPFGRLEQLPNPQLRRDALNCDTKSASAPVKQHGRVLSASLPERLSTHRKHRPFHPARCHALVAKDPPAPQLPVTTCNCTGAARAACDFDCRVRAPPPLERSVRQKIWRHSSWAALAPHAPRPLPVALPAAHCQQEELRWRPCPHLAYVAAVDGAPPWGATLPMQ